MKRLILLFLVSITSYYFKVGVIDVCPTVPYSCYEVQEDILRNNQFAPYQYRILGPVLVRLFMPQDNEQTFLTVYFVSQVVCFALFFTGFYAWLRRWTDSRSALLLLALTALLFPLSFEWYWYAPWTGIEFTLIAWSLTCLSYMSHSRLSPA